MRAPCGYSRPAREAARVALLVAFLLALGLCGALVLYLLREPSSDVASETPPPEKPSAAAPAAAAPEGELKVASGEAEPSLEERPVPAPSGASEASGAPGSAALSRRVFGTVSDDQGQPLAGVSVRWLPESPDRLKRYRHDAALFGKACDPERVPEGRLRKALERSRATESDEDGRYELELSTSDDPGALVASGSGYEVAVRAVATAPSGDASPAAEEAVDAPSSKPPPAAPEAADAAEASPSTAPPDSPGAPPSGDVRADFRLRPAGMISGTVTDKLTGDPADGMVVSAGAIDPDKPAYLSFVPSDAPRAAVGKDGGYALQGLPPAIYRVFPTTGRSAYAPLGSQKGKRVVLERGTEATDVDFEVLPGGWIHGRVTGTGAQPVKDAACSALPEDFMAAAMRGDVDQIRLMEELKSRTDDDGYYELRGLPLGKKYRVAARADGYAPSRSEPVELSEGQPEAEANLSLSRGSSISGRVVFADGRLAPEVKVQIVPDLGKLGSGNIGVPMGGRGRTVTDETGAYLLENLAAGEYRLRAGDFTPQDMFGGGTSTKTVTVDGIADVAGVEIVLEEEGTGDLAGVVVDSWGRPIDGASIRVVKTADFVKISPATARTGTDGAFRLARLGGESFQVGASKSGYASSTLKGVAANTLDLRITLIPNGRVSGRIVTPDGAPPAGGGKVISKQVREETALSGLQEIMDPQGSKDPDAAVNDDGTFSVEAPAGKVEIHAVVPGFAPAASEPLTVAAGEELSGIEIPVTAGAALHGRVTLATQAGVEGATVRVQPVKADGSKDLLSEFLPAMFDKERFKASTDPEGHYEVAHLAPGQYKVTASHPKYAPSDPLTVTLLEDQARKLPALVLSSGGMISGRILDGDKPKAGMVVQIMGAGPVKPSFSDGEGRFEFKGLKAGEYLIQTIDMAAMQKGKMVMKMRTVTLGEDDRQELDLVFGVGHRVVGSIKGLPPAPMRVIQLRRPGGPLPEGVEPGDMKASIEAAKYQAGFASITPEGEYEIADVEPGKYILEIPKMPADPTDLEAYKTMDRTPHYRKEIRVKEEDLRHDVEIK